jgi:hypothetical protein
VELLRVARQGDADAVLDIVSSKKNMGVSVRSIHEVKFSPHISVVHEFQHGIKVEQVKGCIICVLPIVRFYSKLFDEITKALNI